MASPPTVDRSPRKARGLLISALKQLASLKLAVVLIVVLAIVLTAATFLEAAKGREYAQWYVYGSAWFVALLALLAANILAASLMRFPWKTRHIGFLVTHAGLLLLLIGSIQTFVAGIDGRLSFQEGEDADSIFLTDRSELTLSRQGPKGQTSKEFLSFTGGAVDWPQGREIDFGQSDGVGVKVLKFYRHARRVVNLIEDKSKQSGPALRLAITDSTGKRTAEGWKMARQDGSASAMGVTRVAIFQVPVAASSGVEFLQTPDGKLYCRVGVDGKYVSRGEIKEGAKIEVAGGYTVSMLKHLPHARQEVTFRPVELAAGEAIGPEAAALVEIATDGKTQQVWIRRNDKQHGLRRIITSQGPLMLSFGYEKLPLGFSLKLLDFQRLENPGGMGNASFASSVQLLDSAQGIDQQKEISMNSPLVHGKFTFYQSSFQELPGGKEISVLSVTYDPGRFMKYLGSLMICVGIFVMYYMKVPLLRKLFSVFSGKRNT